VAEYTCSVNGHRSTGSLPECRKEFLRARRSGAAVVHLYGPSGTLKFLGRGPSPHAEARRRRRMVRAAS